MCTQFKLYGPHSPCEKCDKIMRCLESEERREREITNIATNKHQEREFVIHGMAEFHLAHVAYVPFPEKNVSKS